ncbi:MAG TPA: FAD-dependent oxidoreductase, partial [Gemmataceae bacterium]|nr:FAD-dependent oxidoreductase [Gemmataceae bacterium]
MRLIGFSLDLSGISCIFQVPQTTPLTESNSRAFAGSSISMHSWSVAILGGGPGGLMTAYQLQKRAVMPFATTIFEASGRLGGKIVTRRFDGAPVPYEAGAAELYDYSQVGEDPLRELIAELGLPTSPMCGATVV